MDNIDRSQIQAEFQRLCELSTDAELSGAGSTFDFEKGLVALVRYCDKQLPHSRPQVVDAFMSVVRGGIQGPLELVPFAMHELRLPEVLALTERWSKEPDPNTAVSIGRREYLAKLQAAYEDPWEDADLWRSYLSNPIDRLK